MNQCDSNIDLYQVYVGQGPIFSGPVILLHIVKAILMEKCCTWDNTSV